MSIDSNRYSLYISSFMETDISYDLLKPEFQYPWIVFKAFFSFQQVCLAVIITMDRAPNGFFIIHEKHNKIGEINFAWRSTIFLAAGKIGEYLKTAALHFLFILKTVLRLSFILLASCQTVGRPLAVYAQSRELKDNISLGSNFQKPQQYFNFECKFNKHQILKKPHGYRKCA